MRGAAAPRAQIVCVGFDDEIEVPSTSSIFSFRPRRLLVVREAHADALRAAARRVGRRDPADLAGHRVALRVVGQRQQQVDVVAELVVARGRHEQAAVGEQRHVGGVERALLAEHELDDARPRAAGGRRAGQAAGADGAVRSSARVYRTAGGAASRRGRSGAAHAGLAAPAIRPAARRSTGARRGARRGAARAAQPVKRRRSAPPARARRREVARRARRPRRAARRGRASAARRRRAAAASSASAAGLARARPAPGSAATGAASMPCCGQRQRLQRLAAGGREQHARRRATPCAASQRARPRSAPAARSGNAWQRLRIVGSSASGAAQLSTKRGVAGRLFERLQQRVGGDARSCARPGAARTTLPRPRADVVCAKSTAARTASTLISLLGLALPPCSARLVGRRQRPSRAARAAPRAAAPAGRGASAPAPAGSWRSGRRAARAAARASHSQACASVERELELADACGAVQQQRVGALRAPAPRRSGCGQPGQRQRAVRRLPSARLQHARRSARQTASRVGAGVDAREALRRGAQRAPRSRRARARRTPTSCCSKRSAARAAARRSAASVGGQVEPERQVGLQALLDPALERAPAPRRRSRGRRPGRRRSRR